jgi:hypothetical protein
MSEAFNDWLKESGGLEGFSDIDSEIINPTEDTTRETISSLQVLEIDLSRNPELSAKLVSDEIAQGRPVAIKFGSVFALIADAQNAEAVAHSRELKGREEAQKFSLMVDFSYLLNPKSDPSWENKTDIEKMGESLIDFSTVNENCRELLLNPVRMKDIFNGAAFYRVTLKPEAVSGLGAFFESQYINSTYQVQCFSFEGDSKAYVVENTVRERLKKVHEDNAGFILITSYNKHGEGSITEVDAARKLSMNSRQHGISLQVNREDSSKDGSYPIFTFKSEGVFIERNGPGDAKVEEELKAEGIEVNKELF